MDAGIRSGSILLGKYRIEGMLGRDGMCIVLAVSHVQFGGELAQGIIHRYICPANVLLTARPDGTALVKVLDFGVSRTPVGGSPVARAEMSGAPGYRAPEQRRVSAELDARTDIWSLGIVLYE